MPVIIPPPPPTVPLALPDALAEGRRIAERRMTSRCKIHRLDGTMVTNSDGMLEPGYSALYTDLPIRLGGSNRGSTGYRTVRVGETEVQVAIRVASLPSATADLRDNDLIELTAGENVGLMLRIAEATGQDQATARRVPVYEIERPGGL